MQKLLQSISRSSLRQGNYLLDIYLKLRSRLVLLSRCRDRLVSELLDCRDQFADESSYQNGSFLAFDFDRIDLVDGHIYQCERWLGRLDINNTIDNAPFSLSSGSREIRSLISDTHVDKAELDKYFSSFTVRALLDSLGLESLPGKKDEASMILADRTVKSRRSQYIQRIKSAIRHFHSEGWYMVFDTLTFSDHGMRDFYDNNTALRDYFRNVKFEVMSAEGIAFNTSGFDGYQYFCVPEWGLKNGRLHFHVLHFLRTLPLGVFDPNAGRCLSNRREISCFKNHWSYGRSMPIAVRYGANDAFSRCGWRWITDKSGNAYPAKGCEAIASYLCKYVTKFSSDKEKSKCPKNKLLMSLPSREFRIRMSRNFGLNLPEMSDLSDQALIQLTRLDFEVTDLPSIFKNKALKEMRLRLASVSVSKAMEFLPKPKNLLRSLRDMIERTLEFSQQSFTDMFAPRLLKKDISREVSSYISSCSSFFGSSRAGVLCGK